MNLDHSPAVALLLTDLTSVAAAGDGPFICPVHAGKTSTLHLTADDHAGVVFRCSAVRCGFVGGPIELYARTRGVAPPSVIEMFSVGGRYEGALGGSGAAALDATRVERQRAELGRMTADNDFADFLVQDGRRYGGGCRSAAGTNGSDPVVLDQLRIGVISRDALGRWRKAAPPRLREFCKALNREHLVLSYRRGHVTTAVAFYDPASNEAHRRPLVDSWGGFLFEDQLTWPAIGRVIIPADEVATLRMLSSLRAISVASMNVTRPWQPADVLGLPGLTEILLVSSPDHQLQLPHLLGYLRVAASRPGLVVRVCKLQGDPGKILPAKLMQAVESRTQQLGGWEFLAATLADIPPAEVATLLKLTRLTLPERRELQRLTAAAPVELRDVIAACPCAADDIVVGSVIYRREEARYIAMDSSGDVVLSDFAFYADHVTRDKDDMIVVGKVRTSIPDEPLYPVRLNLSHFASRATSSNLGNAIWAQIAPLGSRAKLVCAPIPAGDWATLLRSFDQPPFVGEVTELGLDSRGNFHLPRGSFHVGTGRQVADRVAAGTAVAATASYRLVPPASEPSHLEALKRLLQLNNAAAAPYLLFIAACAVNSIARREQPVYTPLHVVLPHQGEHSLWEIDLLRISAAASGTPEIAAIDARKAPDLSGRGTLPFFGCLGDKGKLADVFRLLSVPTVLLCPVGRARELHGLLGSRVTVAATDLDAYKGQRADIDPGTAAALVACVPWAVTRAHTLSLTELGEAPLAAFLHLIAEEAGVEMPAALRQVLAVAEPPSKATAAIFDQLREVVCDLANGHQQCQEQGAVGFMNHRRRRVYIDVARSATALLSRFGQVAAGVAELKSLAQLGGATAFNDGDAEYVSFDKDYWESFVLRLPAAFKIVDVAAAR